MSTPPNIDSILLSYNTPSSILLSVTPVSFITSFNLTTPRNNFTGFLGFYFTVGPQSLILLSLGRIIISGNSATHTVELIDASTGTAVSGGSVSVNTVGGTNNTFKYTALSAPLILQASKSYYLVSQETNTGDQFYERGPVFNTGVASVNASVSSTDGVTWNVNPVTTKGFSYIPVSFTYLLQNTSGFQEASNTF